MRRLWQATVVAGLIVMAGATGRGQVPAGPAAPAGAAAVGAAPPPAAAAAAGAAGEKAGFFKRLCTGLDECRRKICKTQAGKLLNGMTAPLTGMTGGVIPPFCPLMPSDKDLKQEGVAGAAAAAQKEALEAKARRDAVRFLGTLDCRYFPDAAVKLAAALRTDSSECVRYEAALVLGHGCCCTEVTVKALMASVSGTDMDGAPAERSPRVRCAAALALEKCLSCYSLPPEEVEPDTGDGEVKPKIKDKEVKPDGTTPQKLPDPQKVPDVVPMGQRPLPPSQRLPRPATVARARKILDEFNAMLAVYQPVMAAQPTRLVDDRRSVYHLIKDSAAVPAQDPVEPASNPTVVVVGPAVTTPPRQTAAAPTASAGPSTPTPTKTASAGPSTPTTVPTNQPSTAEPPRSITAEPTRAPQPAAPVANLRPAPTPSVGFAPPAPMPPVGPVAQVSAARQPSSVPSGPSGFTPMPAAAPTTPAPVSVSPPVPVTTNPQPAAVQPTPAPVAVQPTPAPVAVQPTPAPVVDPAAESVTVWATRALQGATTAERHAAIRELVKYDWHQHPMVASALLAGAKADPVDAVRVDCLRHLAAYKMAHPQVLAELGALANNEPDTWVRQEAAAALGQLK
jgi:hypothetical protein